MPPSFPEELDAGIVGLRRQDLVDVPQLAKLVADNLDHLSPWLSWATDSAATFEGQKARVREAVELWRRGTDFIYSILESQSLVGVIGAHSRSNGVFEIGYWVDVRNSRRGFCTAAVRALTTSALAFDDVRQVEIRTHTSNRASRSIPIRLNYALGRIDPATSSFWKGGSAEIEVWVTDAGRWAAEAIAKDHD